MSITDLLPFSTALICCICICQDVTHLCGKAQNLDQREKWLKASEAVIGRSSLSILESRSSSLSFGTLDLVVQMKRRSVPVAQISLSKVADEPSLLNVRTTFGPYLTL